MSRLPRFEDYRFVGDRDRMRVYDCDDEGQYAELADLVALESLIGRNRLQAFAPDTAEEAANRGFRSTRVATEA